MDSQVLGAVGEDIGLAYKPETVWCNENKLTSKSEFSRTYNKSVIVMLLVSINKLLNLLSVL